MPKPKNNDSKVVRVMLNWKDELDRRDLIVQQIMADRWLKVQTKLEGNISALLMEIERRQLAGEVVTQQMIWDLQKYKILKSEILKESKQYSNSVQSFIEMKQREFGMIGAQSASDGIKASFVGGRTPPTFPVLNPDAVNSMVALMQNGSPVRDLLFAVGPETLAGAENALIDGIARGWGMKQIADEMAQGLGLGFDRSILIARTEVHRAYRSATSKQYKESNVVEGFYRLVRKGTACFACLMLDGEKYAKAEMLDDHPAGKCVAVPDVGLGRPKWELGRDWFEKLDPEQQKKIMGPERYGLWQKDGKKLKDFVGKSYSETWGKAPRIIPLKELMGSDYKLQYRTPSVPRVQVQPVQVQPPPVPVVSGSGSIGSPRGKQFQMPRDDQYSYLHQNGLRIDTAIDQDIHKEIAMALDDLDDLFRIPKTLDRPLQKSFVGQERDPSFLAYYQPTKSGDLTAIMINPKGDHYGMSFLHEYGHKLDYEILGGGKTATWSSGKIYFPDTETFSHSVAGKKFMELVRGSGKYLEILGVGKAVNPGMAIYLMQEHECFARAFAQYVATKSNNKLFLKELEKMTGTQWDKDDFLPILKYLDELFGVEK